MKPCPYLFLADFDSALVDKNGAKYFRTRDGLLRMGLRPLLIPNEDLDSLQEKRGPFHYVDIPTLHVK